MIQFTEQNDQTEMSICEVGVKAIFTEDLTYILFPNKNKNNLKYKAVFCY